MLGGPAQRSQPTTGVTEDKAGTPAGLASSMKAESPRARMVVRIHRDPDKARYVAEDTKSGLSVLRHQDSTRLRAMCDQMGWQVVDGALPSDRE